ncbi:unnamed protein product [Peniophora sp. CBMAI 1063]|nr:unnamed protein product [Peniophora sp. CBMAI 1063]
MPLVSRPSLGCASQVSSPADLFWDNTLKQRTAAMFASQVQTLANSDANIHAWEKEIASLQRVLAAANRQRNACSITYMLPTEILSRIFEELAFVSPIESHPNASVARKGWLTIVEVCQHWRNVARAHSTLWQRITYVSEPLWELFVTSAGSMPLVVTGRVSAYHPSSRRFLDLLPAQLHRMKELYVHAQASADSENRPTRTRFLALMRSLNTSREALDQLEVLSLRPTRYTGRGLHAEFMKRPLPKLRQVTLQGMVLPLGIHSRSITKLELVETSYRNPGEVLKTLRHMTSLADLTLSLSSGGSHTTTVQPPIALPHVRRFVVKNSLAICTAYLESVAIHPLAFIEIDASDTSHLHDEDLSELGSALFSLDNFEPTVLELSANSFRNVCQVTAWGNEGEGGTYGPDHQNDPTPSHPHPWPGVKATLPVSSIRLIEFESPCAVMPVIMADFLSQVPKAAWDIVTLDGHMHWDVEQILSLFAGADGVYSLIMDNVPPDTIAALCTALTRTSFPGAPLLCIPHLTHLHFDNVDFGCLSEECNGEHSAIPYVRELLSDRDFRGRALEFLGLNSCSISEEYVEDWEDFVDALDWDGGTGDAHGRHTDDEHDEDEDVQGEDGVVSDTDEYVRFLVDDLD